MSKGQVMHSGPCRTDWLKGIVDLVLEHEGLILLSQRALQQMGKKEKIILLLVDLKILESFLK